MAPTDPQIPASAAAPHSTQATPPRRRLSRRASVIGAVLALVVLGGVGWLAWSLTHKPAAPAGFAGRGAGAGTTVGVAVAEQSNIPIILDALGTVTPQATVRVRPQVSGVLTQVLFKEGQIVKAGEVLAVIDPRQFQNALLQATGQRQRDEAQLASARVTLDRFNTLLKQDSIARQDVDTQAALVKQLEGTVVVDKAGEATAQLNLGYSRVIAPISGRVGLRTVDVGNVVSSGDANGVALITQVSPIDVVFSIPQDQVSELQASAGGNTAMKVTALDRTRVTTLDTGSFASLDNQVDTTTGTVKAKARFANSQLTLFPSQFVNVQLLVRTLQNAVTVPVTAVRHGTTGDYVYVVNMADRTVSQRAVTRGQATVDKIVVATGLKAGERVITEGADRLKDGSKVTLPGDQPRTGAGPGGPRGPGGPGGAGGYKRQRPDGANGAAGAPNGAASAPATGASGASNVDSPADPASAASAPQRRRRASQAEGT